MGPTGPAGPGTVRTLTFNFSAPQLGSQVFLTDIPGFDPPLRLTVTCRNTFNGTSEITSATAGAYVEGTPASPIRFLSESSPRTGIVPTGSGGVGSTTIGESASASRTGGNSPLLNTVVFYDEVNRVATATYALTATDSGFRCRLNGTVLTAR